MMNKYDLTKQKTLAELCVVKDSRIDELETALKLIADYPGPASHTKRDIAKQALNGEGLL
jgi:hypothetical protein